MFRTFQNTFKIPELRRRILFTISLLVVYRIGCHVPTPGIDMGVLKSFFAQAQGTLLGLYDIFAGGAFRNAAVFGLGIMPYITSSIIMQLLGAVIPYFQKLHKEGEEGRRKITQYTRYGAVLICLLQSYGVSLFLESMQWEGASAVVHPGMGFRFLTMITMTTGTIFLMWLGEQMTEKGIGNGISLIIYVGILARLPGSVLNEGRQLAAGTRSPFQGLMILAIMVAVIAFVVIITQAQRRIPVQYAKRVVGRKIYGGQATHIPLNMNAAGIIPIIFAQSLMFAPRTITTFFPNSDLLKGIADWFTPGAAVYSIIYALLIVFFAYFYTAIVFNPVELAENMKRYGGFIPGVRPGKRTADYIDRILTRITLPGALSFAVVAILPFFLMRSMDVSFFFGGTSVLIIVGVALDTLKQVESHLVMRHYDGFMKKGRIKGRR